MKNNFYSRDVKLKAVEMRLKGVPVREIKRKLNIKSESQVYTWYYWHRDGEFHRFDQPDGKQYTYGHGPNGMVTLFLTKSLVSLCWYSTGLKYPRVE